MRNGLRKLGLPAYASRHLSTTLRVLIPLVSPNIESCPTRDEATKTLCSPAIGERLKEIADDHWRT